MSGARHAAIAVTVDTAYARRFAALVAIVAAIALALQYVLALRQGASGVGPAMTTLRYFSYFTILSNVAVLLVCATAALGVRGFFRTPAMRGGAALFIGITGCIYATVLAGLYTMTGLQWWVDRVLHYAVPVLYLAWWLFANPHGVLDWRDAGRWLLFPLGYLAWIAIRVAWIERWFPYPFLDIDALGLATVMRNALLVAAGFALGGAVLVSADRWLGRRR